MTQNRFGFISSARLSTFVRRSSVNLLLSVAFLASAFFGVAPNARAQEYSTTPFDPQIRKIPADYAGHDPVAIVSALETDNFKIADVQEPIDSPDYVRRLEQISRSLLDDPLYGELVFSSRFAIVLRNEAEADDQDVETVTCKYQPSTKTMTVIHSVRTRQAEERFWEPGTFPPFAAYFSVCKSGSETYALEILTNQFRKRTPPKLEKWTLVGVEEHEYERLKDSVRVLCAFNLGIGGNENFGVYTPTVRRGPGALVSTEPLPKRPYKLICADEPEFWLYDGATGEILAKYSAPDALNGRRMTPGKYQDGSVAEKLSTRTPEPPPRSPSRRDPRFRPDPFGPGGFPPPPPPPPVWGPRRPWR